MRKSRRGQNDSPWSGQARVEDGQGRRTNSLARGEHDRPVNTLHVAPLLGLLLESLLPVDRLARHSGVLVALLLLLFPLFHGLLAVNVHLAFGGLFLELGSLDFLLRERHAQALDDDCATSFVIMARTSVLGARRGVLSVVVDPFALLPGELFDLDLLLLLFLGPALWLLSLLKLLLGPGHLDAPSTAHLVPLDPLRTLNVLNPGQRCPSNPIRTAPLLETFLSIRP